jgi:transcription elongation factor SPT6
VLTISCGGGEDQMASFAVLVSSSGQLVDHLKLNSIHSRNPQLRAADVTKLRDFVKRYDAPDIVAVSGWSLTTRGLYETVRQALPDVDVIYARDDAARIYQHSDRAKSEFPAFSPILKYCISLARCLQEPITEYASLFNTNQEAVFLRVHPLQNYVCEDDELFVLFNCF